MGIAQDLILRVNNPTGVSLGATPSVTGGLPRVADPNATLASISRGQYDDFVTNFGGFETDLINRARTDTSIIDQAREDAPKAQQLSADIAKRNVGRYGASLDPATAAAMERTTKLRGALGQVQAVNDAYVDQDTVNSTLASRLIDIGNGVQSGANAGLQSAAANQSALNNAYRDARSASRNSTRSTLAGLGSLAIVAAGI